MTWKRLTIVFLLVTLNGLSSAAQDTPQPTNTVPDLMQIVTSSDGHASLRFPAGWIADGTEKANGIAVWLSSSYCASQGFLSSTDYFPSGEVTALIVVDTKENVLRFKPNPTLPSDIATLLHGLVYRGNGTSQWEYGEFKPIEIGNYAAAQVITKLANYAQGEFILIDLNNGYMASVMALTPPNEFSRWEETISAIAQSISYDPKQNFPLISDPDNYRNVIPELTTYKTQNPYGSFEYPSDWAVEISDGLLADSFLEAITSNKNALLNSSLDTVFSDGDVRIAFGLTEIGQATTSMLTPSVLLDHLKKTADSGSSVFDESHEVCFLDHPAIRLNMSNVGKYDGFIFAFQNSHARLGYLWVTSAPSELARWEPVAFAIAASMAYQ